MRLGERDALRTSFWRFQIGRNGRVIVPCNTEGVTENCSEPAWSISIRPERPFHDFYRAVRLQIHLQKQAEQGQ